MAIEHNWSRIILDHQIDFKQHLNYNKSNNFEITLPEPESDLHKYLLKDEYNFDFLTILPAYKEKELENEKKKIVESKNTAEDEKLNLLEKQT